MSIVHVGLCHKYRAQLDPLCWRVKSGPIMLQCKPCGPAPSHICSCFYCFDYFFSGFSQNKKYKTCCCFGTHHEVLVMFSSKSTVMVPWKLIYLFEWKNKENHVDFSSWISASITGILQIQVTIANDLDNGLKVAPIFFHFLLWRGFLLLTSQVSIC